MDKPSFKEFLQDPWKAIEDGYVPSFFDSFIFFTKATFSKELPLFLILHINDFLDSEVRECIPYFCKVLSVLCFVITAPFLFPIWAILVHFHFRNLVKHGK